MTMQKAQQSTQSATRAARLRFALQMAEQAQKVGSRIAQERQRRGWSRPEMARRLSGVSTGNDVYRWEGGKHLPRSDTLEAIADLFEIEVADLHSGPVDDHQEPGEVPDPFATEAEAAGDEVRAKLDEVLDQQAELLAMLSEVRDEQERQRQRQGPGEHGAEETGS